MYKGISFFCLAMFLAVKAIAGGGENIYVYSGYGSAIEGHRVVYLVADIPKSDIRNELPRKLIELQKSYPHLKDLVIFVFPSEEYAKRAKDSMGSLPMNQDPSQTEIESARLAVYYPETRVLTLENGDNKGSIVLDW